jgi:dienelactone hydrolase
MRARLGPIVIIALALVAVSCSSDAVTTVPTSAAVTNSTDAPTTTEAVTTTEATTTTTTTIDPATLARAYTTAGPYPVGVTTAALANGIHVEIWYPAVAGSVGTETYDVRDFTAPAIKAILTADIPATYSYPAARDAAVADGMFPVVLNSHGYSGIRVGSSFLTSHLASWGMIVVSPDHPSRDLYHAVGQITPEVVTVPVDDLLGSLDLITAKGATTGDPFQGHVDTDHVGALGHSAGGGTVLQAALDPRVDGYVSMASGLPSDTTASTVLPDKPSFFLSGALDGVVDPTRTHDAFVAVPAPSLFWKIDGVGHNGFDDFCTFGNGTGIIGIAVASSLGPFLDAQPQFRSLGQDGCIPPAVPVTSTFPIIDHAVTAFFRSLFEIDPHPVGLGADVASAYAEPVTVEQR